MKTLNRVLALSGLVAAPVLSLTSALIPAVAMAHPCDFGCHDGYGHDKIYVVSTLISKSLTYTIDSCKLSEPLSLSRATHHYPLLGELTVDSWKGAYTRSAQVKSVYEDAIFSCRDGYIGSMRRESVELENVPFAVDNPNLQDDVAASYIANAPMTNGEAQAALEKALQNCQQVQAQ
jgi:hypothetical protein